MARLSLLTTGFLLSWVAALPAHAALDEQVLGLVPVATRVPTPLTEPHAVDKAAPAQPAAKPVAPSPSPAAVQPKTARPQIVAKPKPRPDQPRLAAKPKANSVAVKAKATPKKLARSQNRHPHIVREAPHGSRPMREARRDFDEERPLSGPLYGTSPGAPANGCDEACQYRDWLNRYAAWYRDFGRYYYGLPPRPAGPSRPGPPPYQGEIPAAPVTPVQSYRFDQSERDRLDPWHGYNSHSPDNGY